MTSDASPPGRFNGRPDAIVLYPGWTSALLAGHDDDDGQYLYAIALRTAKPPPKLLGQTGPARSAEKVHVSLGT